MRTHLRYLVVACILAVLLAGGVVLHRAFLARQESDPKQLALDLLPNVAQRIRDFHRVKVDKGRKVWEVSAGEAQYYEDEELIVVSEPLISLFMEDGRAVALRGAEGRVFLEGGDLRRVELTGGIRVQFGDYVLETEQAQYDRHDDTIVAPGSVHISGRALNLTGERLEIQVSTHRLLLREHVEMVLQERKSGGTDDAT